MGNVKKLADGRWDKMARAMLDARDSLRAVICKIDRAGKNPEDVANTLIEVRAVIADATDRLRLGLKHPSSH